MCANTKVDVTYTWKLHIWASHTSLSYPAFLSNLLDCMFIYHHRYSFVLYSDVCDVRISVECVYDAFSHLKQRKIDSSGLDSSHLLLALPVIAEFLSSFFTLVLRHGHLPPPLRDCTLVPVTWLVSKTVAITEKMEQDSWPSHYGFLFKPLKFRA